MIRMRHPTTIENLPGELLWEILIRAPAKQLVQMRSVSKHLNHLLSQQSFIKSHLHHHKLQNKKDEILLVLTDKASRDSFSVTAHSSRSLHLHLSNFIKPPASKGVNFLGSVDGLICFRYISHKYDHDNGDWVIQIWNPSLSTILTLPPCYIHKRDFDTTRIYVRFGFDPKTDDYKLVKLLSLPGSDFKKRLHVEVYSMRKGSWELVVNHGFPSNVINISNNVDTVCVDGHNGHIHWFGRVIGSCKIQTIVVFDLNAETFSEISLPDFVVKYDHKPRLWNGIGALYGKLCVISCVEGYENEVWVMNEYGVTESWVKQHVVSNFGCGDGIDHPLGFTLNNEFLFASLKDRLVLYDPITSEVKSFSIKPWHHHKIQVVRYVESLVWIAPAQHGINR